MSSARSVVVAALILGVFLGGCATDRYVGSIGRNRTYSNRGYGLVLNLSHQDLESRWMAIDPSDLANVPPLLRPFEIYGVLDLDGDGHASITETVRYQLPVLRLVHRDVLKGDLGALIEIDVTILGGELSQRPIEALLLDAVKEMVGPKKPAAISEAKPIASRYPVKIAEFTSGRKIFRVAAIDHAGFLAENDVIRRQVVFVILEAFELSDALKQDHEHVLDAILLNSAGGTQRKKEKW